MTKMTEANIRELKNIVKNFRVSELQTLLEFAGRLKAGRKSELLDRALSLIDKGCPTSIVVKINDLNRRRGGNLSSTSSSATSHESSKASASMLTAIPPKIPQTSSFEKMSLSRVTFIPFQLSPLFGESSGIVPTTSSHSLVPVHPDVRLKSLPFYDLVAELVKPSSLSPKGMSRLQANTFTFHLTPQQTEDISASKELIDDCVVEYGLQVLVRFALMETTSEQDDNFPSGISVRVNDKIAGLPNPIPTNKPGVEPKRPGRPVNITHICILSPTVANVISITWSADHIRNFCTSVCLARHLNSDILLSRLKQNGMRHADHTRALIKEKLASSSDSEIATTSLRISLRCPVGKMRMSIPCRSAMCSHLQCFDARTFIQMNEKKPTWTCPICDRPAEFKTLIIDGLFSEILVKASESNDIQFSADGNWFPIRPKEEEVKIEDDSVLVQTISDSPGKADSIEMIDLTESDDDTDSVRSRPSSAFGVEYLPLPEYAKTLSMFSGTTSKECNSGLSFGLSGRGEPANSIASELSLPPPLTLQAPHLAQSEMRFPIHEKPPSLLPFGDIWDYHTVPSSAPLDYPDVRFRPSSSGFTPPSRSDPILAGSSLLSLPMDIEASCHFSSSGSQSTSLTAASSSLSRPSSASPEVISLD